MKNSLFLKILGVAIGVVTILTPFFPAKAIDPRNLDLNTICGLSTGSVCEKGKVAGCKIGYPAGYSDGLGGYPLDIQNACLGADVNEPPACTTSNTFEQGKKKGCVEKYKTGFAAGDSDLAVDLSVRQCPSNISVPAGTLAGAFKAGCNDGYIAGLAGDPLPSWCSNGIYQDFSNSYNTGCRAGHQAGEAAATAAASGNPVAPYHGTNQLIVQFGGLTSNTTPVKDYLNAVYRWSIGLAAILAIFQIVYGGVLYILSAGSLYSQEEATGKMKSAVMGLLLLLSISVILSVFNPGLNIISPDSCENPNAGSSCQEPWYKRVFTDPASLNPYSTP